MKFTIEAVLFIVFLILKLTGVINWSWWWVTSPLWIGIFIMFILYVIAFVVHWKYDK